MIKPMSRAVIVALGVVMAACTPSRPAEPLGPSTPSGATAIPGGPMEPTPTAKNPKIPGSQQEAIDTVLKYLQRIVDALPKGTALDSTDAQGGSNLSCDDDFAGPGPGPTEYDVTTHVTTPANISPTEIVANIGDVWRSWGLKVIERSEFDKPNWFAYADDGYRLQIEIAHPATYPPTLTVISPCFPGDLRDDDLARHNPGVITQSAPTN